MMSMPMGGGGDVAAGSAGFSKLLQALAEQYEQDMATARRLGRTHHFPEQSPRGPVVDKVPETCLPLSVNEAHINKSLSQGRHNKHEAWGEEPTSPPTPGTVMRQQAAIAVDSTRLVPEKKKRTSAGSMDSKRSNTSKLPPVNTPMRRLVRSSLFDRVSASLLILNAIFIGFQVELGFQAEMPLSIDIIDYVFCVCFIIELAMRLYGFGCNHFWTDKTDRGWNIFDFCIVALSTMDTLISITSQGADSPLGNISVLRVIRIVRITRVLRIIRVMKFFQDLRILVAAIGGTLKTASFALMLILFMMYMFGIAVTQMVTEVLKDPTIVLSATDEEELLFFFGSIFRTIFTLFMTISGGIDWKDAAVVLFFSPMAFVFYLLYVALMVLCVMNVLTGMFCQSAIDTAASDRENVIQMQLNEKHRFVDTLKMMFDKMDDSGDGMLRREEFVHHLEGEEMQALLRSLEIEVRDAITLFELLDADESGMIDTEEFVTGCITLRGGAKAVHMEKVSNMNKIFNARFDHLDFKVDEILGKRRRQEACSNNVVPLNSLNS